MSGWEIIQQVFLDGVWVEPGDGAQPACDRGPGAGRGSTGRARNTSTSARCLEEAQVLMSAPAGVLAQVQFIRLPGQAAIADQESGERQRLGVGEYRRGLGR